MGRLTKRRIGDVAGGSDAVAGGGGIADVAAVWSEAVWRIGDAVGGSGVDVGGIAVVAVMGREAMWMIDDVGGGSDVGGGIAVVAAVGREARWRIGDVVGGSDGDGGGGIGEVLSWRGRQGGALAVLLVAAIVVVVALDMLLLWRGRQ